MELNAANRLPYILGGNAKFTVVSGATGARFTYKVSAKKGLEEGQDTVHFVKVLTGPNNQDDFEFLGTVFAGERYFHGKRSGITQDAPSAKAFAWLMRNPESNAVQVMHSGTCSRCGRELTTPESIETGLGPVCAQKISEGL